MNEVRGFCWILFVGLLSIGCESEPPVRPDPVTTVTTVSVSGASVLGTGEQAQLAVTAAFSDGTSRDVSGEVSYQSSNNSVVTVSASGLATAVSPGRATITAIYQGVSGALDVAVEALLPLYALDLSLSRLVIIDDCDASGPGEFTYQVAVRFPEDSRFTVLDETINYPGNNGSAIARSDGERINLDGGDSRPVSVPDGSALVVQLRATEYDGQPADARMNDRSASRTHRLSGGQWSQVGSNQLLLGRTGCQLRLDYRFSASRNLRAE